MHKVKSSYNKVVEPITRLGNALVVLSLLLAGSVLLGWVNVENSTGLGYFLLAQGVTWMIHNFNSKQEN